MATDETQEITKLLIGLRKGKADCADQLVRRVYSDLRRLAGHCMKGERPDHTLQPTALVHEAYVKIFGPGPIAWQNRAHFFAVAAKQMRLILVDHARAARAQKRGAGAIKVTLDRAIGLGENREHNLLELDQVLGKLEKLDPTAGQVVELRFFGGLTDKEVAESLGISFAQVRREWEFARAWMYRQLRTRTTGDP